MSQKIVCIRFTSGEEAIGKLVPRGLLAESQFEKNGPWVPEGFVILETIRGITIQPMGQNQIGIAFVPFAIGNTDAQLGFKLDNCAVAIYPASSDIERGYLEQTSGISLASGVTSRPGIKL